MTLCESWREESSIVNSMGRAAGQSGCELGFIISQVNKSLSLLLRVPVGNCWHTRSRIGRERLREYLQRCGQTVGKQGQAQLPRASKSGAIGLRGENGYSCQTESL